MGIGFASPFLAPTQHPGAGVDMPVIFEDDFLKGGYCPDLALSSESDPAAKFSEVADRGEWLVTRDAAPTLVIADDDHGGVLTITPGTSANDFVSLQANGRAFVTKAGRRIIFKTRIKSNDTDDLKFFVGLAGTDVTGTTAGPILDGTNDSIGFRNVLGNTASFLYIVEDDTSETTGAAGSLTDATFTDLAFELIGTERVNFYVNGLLVGTETTGLIDAGVGLTPTIEVGSPTGTTATNLSLDYVQVIADRD